MDDNSTVRGIMKGSVTKLKVKTLDKYLIYNGMDEYLPLKKKDKCQAISQHIAFKNLHLAISKTNQSSKENSSAKENVDSIDNANDNNGEDYSPPQSRSFVHLLPMLPESRTSERLYQIRDVSEDILCVSKDIVS